MRYRDIVLGIIPRPIRIRLWPLSLRIRQPFRAAFRASGITITILAAAVPLLFSLLSREPAPSLDTILKIFTLLAPLIFASGVITLWTADPKAYARILIAGRPAKEVLFVAASYIDHVCHRTLKHAARAEALYQEIERRIRDARSRDSNEQYVFLPEPTRVEIRQLEDKIRQLLQGLHSSLLRVEEMKRLASDELDIPRRRLCDHIFQYSPAIHRDRLRKYANNWREILVLTIPSRTTEISYLEKIITKNRSFVNNTWRRRRYQHQMIHNRDLHPYIVQFASTHSTSGSLQTYSEALEFIASIGKKRLERSRNTSTRGRVKSGIEERFRFLCRKQRAHPGFDLHTLLLSALDSIESQEGIGPLRDAYQIVKELNQRRFDSFGEVWIKSSFLARCRVSFNKLRLDLALFMSGEGILRQCEFDEPKSKAQERVSLFPQNANLGSFEGLPIDLVDLVESSRDKIWTNGVKPILDKWFDNVKGDRYIVSHGYSRTVLSMLKQIAQDSGTLPLPRLFFILIDEEESLDTRVMEYELKEDRDPILRRFRNLAAGGERHLLNLLGDGDSVLVLLGAERFDKSMHVVHPRGIAGRLSKIIRRLDRRKIRSLVVVVAEGYKCQERSLADNTNFYGQHFDRVDLYPPNVIDVIVADKNIYPENNWERVIEKRLQGAPREGSQERVADSLPSGDVAEKGSGLERGGEEEHDAD